jgi:hypothetical protein
MGRSAAAKWLRWVLALAALQDAKVWAHKHEHKRDLSLEQQDPNMQTKLVTKQVYTTNPMCIRNYCVNPVIPGLMQFGQNVLSMNEQRTWNCMESNNMWKLAGICKRVVMGYNFALPAATIDGQPAPQADVAVAQARQALSAYVAHLSGMGFDFWTYREPWKKNECIQSIWRMACYTHFPRCNTIEQGKYLRPCGGSCTNYISKCGVECCDDGLQCEFTHARKMEDGTAVIEEGYSPHKGPSPLCTGGTGHPRIGLLLAAAVILAILAQ